MNKRINELRLEAGISRLHDEPKFMVAVSEEGTVIEPLDGLEKFAELIVKECIGILETEIELVEGYKSTAHNDFDVRWHDGKITHFTKLIEKSKKHFGVEE